MWLMLAGLAGVCGGGCGGEDLTAPRGAAPAPARVLVVADTLCVRAQFTITGPTSVTTNFPTAAECPSGLLLTRSQPATWVQTPNRRLRLLVRFRNLTGQAVQLPVRLYLPATGTTVVLPAGTPPSKVVAYQPDSSEAGGGRVWFIGGSSVLAAGDSTAEDTLTFQVQSPVTKARWQFQATVEVNDTTTPALPSTWVPLEDSSFTAPVSSAREALIYRKLVSVEFLPTTTGTIIRAFIAKYGAVVAGGFPWGPRGSYVFEVPDPGSSLAAVDSLLALMRSEPGVADAGRLYYRDVLQPRGRYPVDGASGRAAWADTATATVAWRAVRAPLAWGCENGAYGGAGLPKIVIADALARWQFQATVASVDTARPPIPLSTVFPYDSTLIVSPPGDTATHFFRNIFAVKFDDSTSGTTVQAFFQTFGATIIAGGPAAREYYVRTGDPGPTWQAFDQLHAAMHTSVGVRYAASVSFRGPIGVDASRAPGLAGEAVVPARPPDSIPSWLLADSSIGGDGYAKRLVEVLFLATASQAQRQAALRAIRGTVVGGLPLSGGDGYYLVQVPANGIGDQVEEAIRCLMLLPVVQHAARQWRGTAPTEGPAPRPGAPPR